MPRTGRRCGGCGASRSERTAGSLTRRREPRVLLAEADRSWRNDKEPPRVRGLSWGRLALLCALGYSAGSTTGAVRMRTGDTVVVPVLVPPDEPPEVGGVSASQP